MNIQKQKELFFNVQQAIQQTLFLTPQKKHALLQKLKHSSWDQLIGLYEILHVAKEKESDLIKKVLSKNPHFIEMATEISQEQSIIMQKKTALKKQINN